jgi:hypothetical protein
MATLSTEPFAGAVPNPQREVFKRILRSRWTFVALQVLDLLTTLVAFHFGAFEMNPLVARLTVQFGWLRGVLISKLIAVAIAMGVRKRLWIVNILYTAIVAWNLIVIVGLLLHEK